MEKQMRSKRAVLAQLDIKSPTTLRSMIESDGFPEPYEIIRGKKHWDAREVDCWLQHRMAEQRGVAA